MKKNLVLIGMRGSGKSHLGSVLAEKRGLEFVDTDAEIERQAGKTIPEIVAEQGWEGFRKMEEELCREVGKKRGAVISVGGGVVMNPKNVESLKKNGFFLFFFVRYKELFRRLSRSKKKRPSLKPGLSLAEEIKAIWRERKGVFYEVADAVFEQRFFSDNPHENVERNVGVLEGFLEEKGVL